MPDCRGDKTRGRVFTTAKSSQIDAKNLAFTGQSARRSQENSQNRSPVSKVGLIPKMGNRTVGCAKRPLFPAESGNKLMPNPKRRTYMLAFLRFAARDFQAAKPRVWQVRCNSARRV